MLRAGDISPRHVILHRLINDEESQPAGITQLLSVQALSMDRKPHTQKVGHSPRPLQLLLVAPAALFLAAITTIPASEGP
jgi:hypothetical protein